MIETKLEKMKEASGMTCTEIAIAADLPEATVRKVLTGKTPDPRYDTLYRIVTAMGYTMNDLVEFDVKIDCEEDSEECIKMLKRFYADRLRELHANYAGYLRSLKRDKMIIAIALGVVLVLLFAAIIIDTLCGNIGWIRH